MTPLALLPTPLDECSEPLPGGARLLVKRDDLTGLGLGGNKARKLDVLCAEALADGCDALVTVGGGQSNHCRMTAAAGARLGLPVHLVLGGDRPAELAGNQLLMALFGAELHFAGTDDWIELAVASEALVGELQGGGLRPALIPIGGSTPAGASAFADAYAELRGQLAARRIEAAAIVITSSSGGTHAGLLAGRVRASGGPPILAIGVAKGPALDIEGIGQLADATLSYLGDDRAVDRADIEIDDRWLGEDYEVPTAAGDTAIQWAARHGGWVLDRTYTGKGFSGLLGHAADGRWGAGETVVFWHTGGSPAVFAPGGVTDVMLT